LGEGNKKKREKRKEKREKRKEKREKRKEKRAGGCMKVFLGGVIAGFTRAVIICGLIAGLVYYRNKNREILKYAEEQIEIEALREDIINRDPAEFLEVPGVRGAADGARDEFDRKRDEALHRFRSRLSSEARLAD
jgi:hypothetical protein